MGKPVDPTLELLERLEDDSLWDIERNVPVFRPHERKGKDGKPIKVDIARLKRIVANAKKSREEDAVVPRISIGHIRPEKPEEEQPEFVGYADNWRIGTFGPKKIPCILVDNYYEKSCHDKVYLRDKRNRYPYRSVEFYPQGNQITSVALLKRDPQLDMGVLYTKPVRSDGILTYEKASGGGTYFYAMGGDMPDQTPIEPPKPAPGADDMDGDMGGDAPPEDQEPEGYPEWRKQMDHHSKHDPVMKYMKKCYDRDGGGEEDDDFPGSESIPAKPEAEEDIHSDEPIAQDPVKKGVAPMQRKGQPQTYAGKHIARELIETRKKLAASEARERVRVANYNRDQAKAIMGRFQDAGIIMDDPRGMFELLKGMTDQQRKWKEDEVLIHYTRDDNAVKMRTGDITGGSMLQIADDPELYEREDGSVPSGRADPRDLTTRDMPAYEEYCRKHEGMAHEQLHEKAKEFAIQQRRGVRKWA